MRQAADRQPRRDRLPHHPHRPRDGDRHGRRPFRGRQRRAPCRDGGRGARDRPGPRRRELPECRRDPARRGRDRRRRHPPRLRLPVRERGFRRGGHRGRADLGRTVPRHDPPDGRQAVGPAHRRTGGRSGRARQRALWHRRTRRDRRGRPKGGLSAPDQGRGGRRRYRHAPGRRPRRPRRGGGHGPGRGRQGVRQRRHLPRTLPAQGASRRGAGLRLRRRQRDPPARARLLPAAPLPEGDRGGPGARPVAGDPCRPGRRRLGPEPAGFLQRRRHRRVHPRCRRPESSSFSR